MEIDKLEIQVEAQASKAAASLNTLINRLDRVSASLSTVNSRGLATMGAGVNKLANAMNNFSNNTKTADFSRLSRNLEKISSADFSGMAKTASAISQMSTALGKMGTVSTNAQQLGDLAKNISKLGNKSVDNAIKNMPQLATSLDDLMRTLSKAPRVSNNLIQMTNALANLSSHGRAVGSSSRSLISGLNGYSNAADKAHKSTRSLASAFGRFYASYWLLFRGIRKLGGAIDISSQLTEVQNVVDVAFGKFKSKVEDFSKVSISNFGMSELTAKQISSRFQSMGTAMGFARGKMSDMSVELTKLSADMASFYNVEQTDVARDLESIFTGQTRPMRTYGIDLTQATLQEWAMKQGLDANMKSMSQAEKTMLRYQYVLANTTNAQGDFARTSGTWANQTRILSQQLQQLSSTMGGVFINALKPLVSSLNVVMAKINQFAVVISNALGKIFGWKYEVSDVGITDDLTGGLEDTEDAFGDAGKAAKKFKSTVLGIDELNINSPDDKDSSNGNSIWDSDIAIGNDAQGQWVQTDKFYESDIDSLFELGTKISDTLADALNSIPWDKVYKTADNFGSGLAEFLNGLITPELFGSTGKTVAGALNTALHSLDSFGEEV